MSEIVTYDTQAEAVKWRPYREGFDYKLYLNKVTNLFQWINDPVFALQNQLFRVYPDPEPVTRGFGLSTFGTAPYGR